jgi:hypothetical protein
MEEFKRKMEEIEEIKNDEEVLNQFLILNIILFICRN